MYFKVFPRLWPFRLQVFLMAQQCDRSISSFINEQGSFANIISPARKKINKYSKKPDTYQTTMDDWIDIYQKFKDTK